LINAKFPFTTTPLTNTDRVDVPAPLEYRTDAEYVPATGTLTDHRTN